MDSNPGNKNKFVIPSSTAVLLSKLCVDYGTWVWVGCVLCFFFFFLSFYNFACFCCLALGYFTMIKFFGSKQGIGNSEKAFFFFLMNFM